MSIHAELIGDNVHQPKGANQASSGQVIKADGTGQTSWVDLFINRLVTSLPSPFTLTDSTEVATTETEVKTVNNTQTDKNFHAIVEYINNNNIALTNKLNELITLLKDLKITRDS